MVRLIAIASVHGAASGLAAGLLLVGMQMLSALIWRDDYGPLSIAAIIMAGGLLIAVLRRFGDEHRIDAQIAALRDPISIHPRRALVVGVSAIVAVAFGGAVGPEAGLIAVVSELSVFVTKVIARSKAEQQLVGQSGAAGGLAGLYASPPGAAVYAEEREPGISGLLLLAGLCGLAGFWLILHLLGQGAGLRLHMPAVQSGQPGLDVISAVIPALFGVLMGVVFIAVRAGATGLLARVTPATWAQTLIGTVVFALLAALLPLLRFSGHDEFGAIADWAGSEGAHGLLALGLLKALACAICIASGWRGGAIFPLMFAGAAAGASISVLFPGVPLAVTMASGMGAAAAIGLGRPLVAGLIVILLAGGDTALPVLVGVLIAHGCLQLFPQLRQSGQH